MNQKEFELIADALDDWYTTYAIDYAPFKALVIGIADSLEQYKSFDRSKFLIRVLGVAR